MFDSSQLRASFELAAYGRASFPQGKPLLVGAMDAMKVERCYDFTQVSRYVDDSPETWRLAVDAT